jgi:DNA polymerase III sliding clamp (beta) subunit (PCNA family)
MPSKLSKAAWDALQDHSISTNLMKLREPLPVKKVMEEIKRVLRPEGGRWKGTPVEAFVFANMEEVKVREAMERVLAAGHKAEGEETVQTAGTGIMLELEVFTGILKKVKEVVSKKDGEENPILLVLRNMLIWVKGDKVVLVGTDLAVTVLGEMSIEHQDAEFKCLVPFKALHDFVTKLDSDVCFCPLMEDGEVIRGASFTTDADDSLVFEKLDDLAQWPELPAFPEENEVKINHDMVHWLKKSLLTVAKDSLRPVLCKVCMRIGDGYLKVVTTNTYALFEHRFEIEDEEALAKGLKVELLINSVVVKALGGFEKVAINWNGSHVGFKAQMGENTITIIGTLQDEQFPNYEGLMPKNEPNVTFNREALINVMEKMEVSKSAFAELYLKREEGFVVFEALDVDNYRKVKGKKPADYKGPCDKLMVSPGNLLLLMGQLECERVSMAIYEPNKAVLLLDPDDADYRAIIMPSYDKGESN